MERTELVANADLAEKAERYEDVVKYMKQVAELDDELERNEKNLLSVGYKNVVGMRRKSWRIISSIEAKGEDGSDSKSRASQYRGLIEIELNDICKELLTLLENHLIQSTNTNESRVFYKKMEGDYYRYLVEVASSQEREKVMVLSEAAYLEALQLAKDNLAPLDTTRLELALNFSVFCYEILQSKSKAFLYAKEAFDEAIAELGGLNEDSYKDSTLIMRLLEDNLTLWASEATTED